jgi:hypothetical protein
MAGAFSPTIAKTAGNGESVDPRPEVTPPVEEGRLAQDDSFLKGNGHISRGTVFKSTPPTFFPFFTENQARITAGLWEGDFPRAQKRFFDPASSRSAAKS